MLFSSFVMQQGYAWQIFRALGYGVKEFFRNEICIVLLSVGAGIPFCFAVRFLGLRGLTEGLLATVILGVLAAAYVWWIILFSEQRELFFRIARHYAHGRGASK